MTQVRHVHYDVIDAVAEITLDHPPVNAIDLELIQNVVNALERARRDETARAVILKSAHEKAFCAGLDLKALKGKGSRGMRELLDELYVGLFDVQYRLGKPSIAAVRGAARAGGMTLAVSCDMIIGGAGDLAEVHFFDEAAPGSSIQPYLKYVFERPIIKSAVLSASTWPTSLSAMSIRIIFTVIASPPMKNNYV